MLKFIKENHNEKVGLAGIVCIFLGIMIFFGMTPRGQKANEIGEAWIAAVLLVAAGLILFVLNWYWNR